MGQFEPLETKVWCHYPQKYLLTQGHGSQKARSLKFPNAHKKGLDSGAYRIEWPSCLASLHGNYRRHSCHAVRRVRWSHRGAGQTVFSQLLHAAFYFTESKDISRNPGLLSPRKVHYKGLRFIDGLKVDWRAMPGNKRTKCQPTCFSRFSRKWWDQRPARGGRTDVVVMWKTWNYLKKLKSPFYLVYMLKIKKKLIK